MESLRVLVEDFSPVKVSRARRAKRREEFTTSQADRVSGDSKGCAEHWEQLTSGFCDFDGLDGGEEEG